MQQTFSFFFSCGGVQIKVHIHGKIPPQEIYPGLGFVSQITGIQTGVCRRFRSMVNPLFPPLLPPTEKKVSPHTCTPDSKPVARLMGESDKCIYFYFNECKRPQVLKSKQESVIDSTTTWIPPPHKID